jgi:hypothetical protein
MTSRSSKLRTGNLSAAKSDAKFPATQVARKEFRTSEAPTCSAKIFAKAYDRADFQVAREMQRFAEQNFLLELCKKHQCGSFFSVNGIVKRLFHEHARWKS